VFSLGKKVNLYSIRDVMNNVTGIRLCWSIYLLTLFLLLSGCTTTTTAPTLAPTDTPSPTFAQTTAASRTPQTTPSITPPFPTQTQEWSGGIPVEDFENASPEAVTEALMEQFLESYTLETIDSRARLADFRIEKVEIPDEWQCPSRYDADFIAQVTYSVQPVNELRYHWWAADGDFGEDNWILNKSLEVAIRQRGGFYEMTPLGVPVC
jgi:hypothetical protein